MKVSSASLHLTLSHHRLCESSREGACCCCCAGAASCSDTAPKSAGAIEKTLSWQGALTSPGDVFLFIIKIVGSTTIQRNSHSFQGIQCNLHCDPQLLCCDSSSLCRVHHSSSSHHGRSAASSWFAISPIYIAHSFQEVPTAAEPRIQIPSMRACFR